MSTSFVGRRIPAETVRVRREALRVPIPLQLLWAVLKLLVKVVLIVAASPVLLGIAAASVLAWSVWQLLGPSVLACAVLLAVAGLLGLRHWSPNRFGAWVQAPLRSRWRRFSVYRYKWPATMDLADLNKRRDDGTAYAPRLLTVRSGPNVDVVRARMLAAQTVNEWGKASDALCQTFGALSCRVRSIPNRPHDVELSFLRSDPLLSVVQPYGPRSGEPVRLDSLPVGLQENGEPYRLQLLGSHVLVVGATGAGKSSVLWSVVDQLAPAIADGTVMLLGVDPKAMEFGMAGPLFTQMSYASASDHADLLEEAVEVMRDRQAALRGVTRLHTPTADDPLIVVLIDELGALSYVTERDTRKRIDAALALLLSQGRAVGVSVVAGIQDPRKETVPLRGLFPIRVALRLSEADEVTLVFGSGARDRGARCDEIPESMPGVAYVQVDGVAEPVRVRFAHVTDQHIAALAGSTRPSRLSLVSDLSEAPEAA